MSIAESLLPEFGARRCDAPTKGTAIATFVNGKYPNQPTGNHAAIYVSQDGGGLWVYDQWAAQGMVKKRYIRFKGGVGSASNDGDAFSVIE